MIEVRCTVCGIMEEPGALFISSPISTHDDGTMHVLKMHLCMRHEAIVFGFLEKIKKDESKTD